MEIRKLMFRDLYKELKGIDEKELVTPEELHQMYLDGSHKLDPDNFNDKAQVPFEELPEPQKKLDKFIADEINAKVENV